jgi:segregation and condensation protein B
MSLKAKLEAVIYAAEEPVTLAQLAVLFAADALESKSEQEAASASESSETRETAESQPTLVEEFVYPEAEPAAETVSNSDSSPEQATDQENPPSDEASAKAELEARRLARLRDREARAVIQQLIEELIDDYVSDDRGIEIRQIAGGYRMATKPECHDAVRSFVKSLKPPLKLSLPALETLAVVAYKQPVTAPEVNEIRGVDSSGVFGSLLARKLITTAGRKQVIGRPILYKTTREFLLRFGLKDVSELPSMEEFEKMAAIELDEPELASDGKTYPPANQNMDLNLELDESDDQPGDEFQNVTPETT